MAKRTKRKRKYKFSGEIEDSPDGYPVIVLPLDCVKVLGKGNEDRGDIPVRVTMKGVDFHARLTKEFVDNDFPECLDFPYKYIGYYLYMYQDMRKYLELRYNEPMDLVFVEEPHPLNRRGKRVPKHWNVEEQRIIRPEPE